VTKSNKKPFSSPSGSERRKAKRRPILDTFSVFVVVPKKGIHRLEVSDISETGMAFDLDVEGEETSYFPTHEGDTIDLRFYLNNSLYIPLSIQVIRVEDHRNKRRIGAQFQEKSSPNYQAFLSFIRLLDQINDIVQMDAQLT
jgi:hypothetical protein